MRSLSLLLLLTLVTLSTVHAAGPQSVGLKEFKSLVNRVEFASAKLEKAHSETAAIEIEKQALPFRKLHIDQVTAYDAYLEAVKFGTNSVFVNFKF